MARDSKSAPTTRKQHALPLVGGRAVHRPFKHAVLLSKQTRRVFQAARCTSNVGLYTSLRGPSVDTWAKADPSFAFAKAGSIQGLCKEVTLVLFGVLFDDPTETKGIPVI